MQPFSSIAQLLWWPSVAAPPLVVDRFQKLSHATNKSCETQSGEKTPEISRNWPENVAGVAGHAEPLARLSVVHNRRSSSRRKFNSVKRTSRQARPLDHAHCPRSLRIVGQVRKILSTTDEASAWPSFRVVELRLGRQRGRFGFQRSLALADAVENGVVELLARVAGRQARGSFFKQPMVTGQPLVPVSRLALFTLVERLDQAFQFRMQGKPPLKFFRLLRRPLVDGTCEVCCAELPVRQ